MAQGLPLRLAGTLQGERRGRGGEEGWWRGEEERTPQAARWSVGMWWRRSLPRHIGLELLVYIVLYYSIQLLYRWTLQDLTENILPIRPKRNYQTY